jgi:type IV pilus assembly protein PilE
MKEKGFTLIELVIVVAIIGILAAIAYPSYEESVRKSRRADAQGVLMEAAQWLERQYTENNTYTGATIPAGLSESPKEGDKVYYDIQFAAGSPTANDFTIQAAPRAGSAQNNDKCGTFTLTSTGVQDITGQNTGIDKDDCWRK